MLKTFPDVNKNVDAYCLEIPYAAKYELLLWYLFLMHLGMVNRAATVDLQD